MNKEFADEYICPVCGTYFICPHKSMWVYKKTFYNKEHIFCSYRCMQKKKADIEAERAKKPNRRGRKSK